MLATTSPRLWRISAMLVLGLSASTLPAAPFIRGDANVDQKIDLSDAVGTFGYLFLGGELECLDAADSDDSGLLDISDGIFVLTHVFLGGPPPPPPSDCGVDPTPDGLLCEYFDACPDVLPEDQTIRAGHILNRIAYGPSVDDLIDVIDNGIEQYAAKQLDPDSIPDSSEAFDLLENFLTVEKYPSLDFPLIKHNAPWRVFPATQIPPAGWTTRAFDDSSWPIGVTRVGFGYGDVNTQLQSRPASVFFRRSFFVDDVEALNELVFAISYDDGFVAYINGVEFARRNLSSTAYNTYADERRFDQGMEEFDLNEFRDLIEEGPNVIAVQVHNSSQGDNTFVFDAEVLDRTILSDEPYREYPSIFHLKAMTQARGVFSRRQLQVVLADFWENHFTTDYDKLANLFAQVTTSDGSRAMSFQQAAREAANVEAREYHFFLENGLGYFEDLLRHSATSPSMLVYLDNIQNFAQAPNENYSREVFELHAFGVDRGYTQADIETASRAFTGWSICKNSPADADDPNAPCGVQFDVSEVVPLGGGWKVFRGLEEPTPSDGLPTIEWTEVDYDDNSWIDAETGLGYGDAGNATQINGMRGSYNSLYMRRRFQVTDPVHEFERLVLRMNYDDGFVAYLNGFEVARSFSMFEQGSPPTFDQVARYHRDVDQGPEIYNLNRFLGLLREGDNVLSIQIHNRQPNDVDLSARPELLEVNRRRGGVDLDDRSGIWKLRFLADFHDTDAKLLFEGTPWELTIPARRPGSPQGFNDGYALIEAIVDAPQTASFICEKLIRKFVSDEVPTELLADCIAAWNSTSPKGHIGTVVATILQSDAFWSDTAFRAKIKDPLEFTNSTMRATIAFPYNPFEPVVWMQNMGMHQFTRDDPDGWPEEGSSWVGTAGLLHRVRMAQDLGSNSQSMKWPIADYLRAFDVETSEDLVGVFNLMLFQGSLRQEEIEMLIEFIETDNDYASEPFDIRAPSAAYKIQSLVSLMLSLPQWNVQ